MQRKLVQLLEDGKTYGTNEEIQQIRRVLDRMGKEYHIIPLETTAWIELEINEEE